MLINSCLGMPPGVIFISVAVRHDTNKLRNRSILIFIESLPLAVKMRKTNLGRGYTNMSENSTVNNSSMHSTFK